MKLSEIKGERTLDVIADLIDPIANIAEDKETAALFKREKLPDGMTVKQFLLSRARKAAPSLLKGHKDDLITILATIDGVEKSAYAESLTLAKLIADVSELMTDTAFSELFTSAQSGTGGGSSTSAQENTEAPEV